jgi:hypothetical protein
LAPHWVGRTGIAFSSDRAGTLQRRTIGRARWRVKVARGAAIGNGIEAGGAAAWRLFRAKMGLKEVPRISVSEFNPSIFGCVEFRGSDDQSCPVLRR